MYLSVEVGGALTDLAHMAEDGAIPKSANTLFRMWNSARI